jgi:hypothetical protein
MLKCWPTSRGGSAWAGEAARKTDAAAVREDARRNLLMPLFDALVTAM